MNIIEATGSDLKKEDLNQERMYYVKQFIKENNAVCITNAINEAITLASECGGTVVFEPGEYRAYTIELKSNVNILLMKDAILYAAKTDFNTEYFKQKGEGGNYLAPEVNLYAGLQDHGHTYFANSLIYGHDIYNVKIYGEGLIDGSFYNEETGYLDYVLWGGDPGGSKERNLPGHNGSWFGNKAIALVRCKNIILTGISVVIGGHFAIIAEGVDNMLIDDILVDTTRDALDIDCCQNVTVINSTFNSLTDDALVIKASYGAGIFMPAKNILIDNCKVCGYDAKSVYMKKYTCDKLVAEDRCGPTGRVKLGTESTCGYEIVTIRNVRFEHSRGFALEAVDCSDLHDIIFENCEMYDISSSPIFIRTGDRQRIPVTGKSKEETIGIADIRINNPEYVIPDNDKYDRYPALRFSPSYNYTRKVNIDGKNTIYIVDNNVPARINENADIKDEKHANATSRPIAKIYNIAIRNVKAVNVDPRYPVIIAGLVDSKIENIIIENIDITYRGGMNMNDAVYEQQMNTCYEYRQYMTTKQRQIVPWMVNSFFCKNEGLLPRADYDKKKGWIKDPYNVPELPATYPEPSIFGILPAYGMYIRHAKNLSINNIATHYIIQDDRHAVVLDDVSNIAITNAKFDIAEDVSEIVLVTNNYKRHTGYEYLKNEEYFSTSIDNYNIEETHSITKVTVNAPAPGTPEDSLYEGYTVPMSDNGFVYKKDEIRKTLPASVIRPYFVMDGIKNMSHGESFVMKIKIRDPYAETLTNVGDIKIYNESVQNSEYVYKGSKRDIRIRLITKDKDADYDEATRLFRYTPSVVVNGEKEFIFEGNDGIMPFMGKLIIRVSD